MKPIRLSERHTIKDESPAYIIAEMSANHGGDLERAKEIVRLAKASGADCIKLQTYTADTMTFDSPKPYFSITEGTWKGYSLYNLYDEAHTPWEWHQELQTLAEALELDFLSTPFDRTAVDYLEAMNVTFYKIASFELTDTELVGYIASKGKPIIMSTGMSTIEEIQRSVELVRSYHDQLILLKCTSAYPANKSDMNIRTMADLREKTGVHVGLSDHSSSHLPVIAAVANGAKVIEKHFCVSREIKTPDSSFSLEPKEFEEMVAAVRETEAVMGTVGYGMVNDEKKSKVFRRSIFTSRDIKKGERITEENIRIIRPSDGLEPRFFREVIGCKATNDIDSYEPLKWAHIDKTSGTE